LKLISISSDSKYKKEIVKTAKWIERFLNENGIEETKIIETRRHPVVYGSYSKAGDDKPTVLIYGHYDVQPPDPMDLWESNPFQPIIRDNLLFARGSSDMKGQLFTSLAAIKAIASTSKLPINLKFLIEGEEEIGSPSMVEFLEKHKALFKSDFVLNLDAGMIGKNKPTIVYGLRGLAYFEIHIKGPANDLHSGLFGGVVYNPIQALCELVAKMKDKNGYIRLPNFYEKVLPISKDEKKNFKTLNLDEQYYKEQTGVEMLYGEKNFTPIERIGARPTLDINGILSGYTGEGPKTVIPAEAMAKISMRLVPDQTPSDVHAQLIEFMEENAPEQIKWEVFKMACDPACLTDLEFYGTKCFRESLKAVFGKTPVFLREGGSIPIVSHFQEALGIESVLSGFGLPEDRIHSPNERMDLDLFWLGIETVIDFIFRVAESCKG